jgi:hypothetical protein
MQTDSLARRIAMHHVDFAVDDSLNERTGEPVPEHARLVVWTFENTKPLIVAVWSYLPGVRVSDPDAIELAKDLCGEKPWRIAGNCLVGEVSVI